MDCFKTQNSFRQFLSFYDKRGIQLSLVYWFCERNHKNEDNEKNISFTPTVQDFRPGRIFCTTVTSIPLEREKKQTSGIVLVCSI